MMVSELIKNIKRVLELLKSDNSNVARWKVLGKIEYYIKNKRS